MAKHRAETSRSGLHTTTRRTLAAAIAAGALTAVGQPMVANAAEIDSSGVHPQTVQSQTTGANQPSPVKLLVNSTSTAPSSSPSAQPRAEAANGYVKPVDGRVTSGFGAHSGSGHDGVDIANKIGTPIHSVTSGEVISAGPAHGFGQWVRVKNHDGAITIYGHVNTIDVKVGQHVTSGQQIATVGNKGEATGPHLHFGVQQGNAEINPIPWLDQHGVHL